MLPAEARSYIEKFGGFTPEGLAKAYAKAMDDNNRLAALARAGKGQADEPPATDAAVDGADVPTGDAQEPPDDVPETLDPAFVRDVVLEHLGNDPTHRKLDQRYAAVKGRLEKIEKEHPDLDNEITYLGRRLKDEDLQVDSLARERTEDRLRELERIQSDRIQLEGTRDSLLTSWRERYRDVEQHVIGRHQQALSAVRNRREQLAEVSRRTEAIVTGWKPALQAAMQRAGLDPTKYEAKVDKQARLVAEASIARGVLPDPADLAKFFDDVVSDYRVTVIDAHRDVSAEFGERARLRANEAAPPPAPAATAAPMQSTEPKSLHELHRLTRQRVTDHLRAAGG